ncbi:MAG: ribosome maturation factor RimM [Anaerovoracaceae bacterium]|nr:ribosome maturation factor RimM [Bacillota bacterium]MDY2670882.1 ribosome maturation factor RimM [Anaerovoracaceae bacterium]
MDRIKVGKIVGAFGIRGELKVLSYADKPHRFEELDSLYAGKEEYHVKNVRYQKDMVLLRLEGVDDRNAAEKLRGKFLEIDKSELRELDEDEYFVFDLIGLEAVDQEGKHIGKVTDVIQNSAQDLYEIETDDGVKHLVPAAYELVTEINIDSGIMRIKPIPGLLD